MADSDRSLISRQYEDAASKRIDIRSDIHNFFNGSRWESIRGLWIYVWKADLSQRVAGFSRTAEHYREGDMLPDELQSGFSHTRHLVRGWSTFTGGDEGASPFGLISPNTRFFYVEWDVFGLQKQAECSEIWTIKLDSNGDPVTENGLPILDVRHVIRQAIPYREINGRIEYWRLRAERQAL